MIRVENHKALIEGIVIEISDNVLGVMEALNTYLAPNDKNGEFFWSSLFSAKNKDGVKPALEFVRNLNTGFDIYQAMGGDEDEDD